jgi:iron complex transport system substrate-binding protein
VTSLTRRRLLTASSLSAVAALAACSSQDSEAASNSSSSSSDSSPAGPRTVETTQGTVQVPAAPTNVLALDEYAAMNAFAVGLTPQTVFGTLQSTASQIVLSAEGVDVQDKSSFFASPNLEEIAAVAPDLILMSNTGPLVPLYDQLSAVAPTLALPYSGAWRDVLSTTGEYLGADGVAAGIITTLETRIAEVKGGMTAGQVVSMLLSYNGGAWTIAPDAPVSLLVNELGLVRPADQDTAAGVEDSVSSISAERLPDQDGDVVAVMSGNHYDAAALRATAGFSSIPAVAAGRSFDVSGDIWFASHPLAVAWILDDLEAMFAGAAPSTDDDAAQRWAAFGALGG